MPSNQTIVQFDRALQLLLRIRNNIEIVIQNDNQAIDNLLIAMISGGHVLLEDVPGTGKTTMAKTLAKSIDADFSRIQFTPDLLPTDILGVSIYNQRDQDFQFRPGPIFSQILLADEVNRASPRTQSALLEAMAENQVSIENKQFQLPDLFFVIATQNPIEFHGTYPLPEAQMDRFAMRFKLGYISIEQEVKMLNNQIHHHPLDDIQPVVSAADIFDIKRAARDIRISEELKFYIVSLVAATRNHEKIQMGASSRASLSLMKCAQSLALMQGLEYVLPEHIQHLAAPVIAHRLVLHSDVQFGGGDAEQIVSSIIEQLEVPA